MRSLVLLLVLQCVIAGGVAAIQNQGTVGCDGGITLPGPDSNPCGGTLLLNWDGSAECGYGWQYGGVAPPYYGAFAECFEFEGELCGIELILTGIGYPCFGSDLYVWDDDGGIPGIVLSLTQDVDPCPVATWPNLSTHDFAIEHVPVSGSFWVGFWTDNSNSPCPYFIGADCYGPETGCPLTNIAPGIGYPTGWQNTSIVWGPTACLGIGAWCVEEGTPAREASWGTIKADFR